MKAFDGSAVNLRLRAWLTVAMCLILSVAAYGYSSGPPNGVTGAPGEGTCHDCHNSFDLNSGAGTLTITAPDQFEAEQTYDIVVSLAQATQTRWGFEFTPLDIGTCTITDEENTQASISGGNTYVKQTSQGTYAGETLAVLWTFQWTAPADPPEQVTFYAAGNAADNNGSTSGDYVYTTTATSTLLIIGADERAVLPSEVLLVQSRPNPARENVIISYDLPQTATTVLRVYDTRGSLVWESKPAREHAGHYSLLWNTTNLSGKPVPDGLYVIRLSADDQSATRRTAVVR
jgi:hypothetical protein